MKVYSETLTVQASQRRELINITEQVKAAQKRSEVTEGIALVSALHINAAIIVHEDEPGLHEDFWAWLDQVAPEREDYKHGKKFESNAGVNLRALLLRHQAVVPIAEGRLDLGPWQSVFFVDLDGGRPKRYTIKVLGA